MNITIRSATPADAGAIHRLNREALGYNHALPATAEAVARVMQDAAACLLVAEAEGRVLGYIHGGDYRCTYAAPMKNVLALAVDPAAQGTGVGRRLLAALEAWAREDGADGVRLVSGEDRTGAHAFYAACGYTHRKNQKNFCKLF